MKIKVNKQIKIWTMLLKKIKTKKIELRIKVIKKIKELF